MNQHYYVNSVFFCITVDKLRKICIMPPKQSLRWKRIGFVLFDSKTIDVLMVITKLESKNDEIVKNMIDKIDNIVNGGIHVKNNFKEI